MCTTSSVSTASSPLVSVIIPVHNTERYLGEALDSVRAQSFRAFEIIVVDDGSTDDSAGIAQSRGDVRFFHQDRRGAGAARNRGVEEARGEFIAFLDADDFWTSNKLALQLEMWRSMPTFDAPTLLFGHAQQFWSPDVSEQNRASIRLPGVAQPATLPGTLFLSRADFWKVGPYQTGIGVDIDWFLGARDGGARIHISPELLLYRRVHEANTSRTQPQRYSQLARAVKASLDRRRQSNA